jgi:hypothetical protein
MLLGWGQSRYHSARFETAKKEDVHAHRISGIGTYAGVGIGFDGDAGGCAAQRIEGNSDPRLPSVLRTLNDHAERGFATCHVSSAIAPGAMKKSSGLVLKRSRAHGTSITASMTM